MKCLLRCVSYWMVVILLFSASIVAAADTVGDTVWIHSTQQVEQAPINALVIDNNNQVIYAGSANGISKSTDRGATWSASSGLNYQVFSLAIDNKANLFAGTDHGVFTSSDGGATWRSTSSGLTSSHVWALAIDPADNQTIYAGTSKVVPEDAGGVYKSSDGGSTWQPMSSGLESNAVASLAVDPLHPGTVYAGTGTNGGANGRGVYKSIDGGLNWTAVNSGLQYKQDVTVIYALTIDPRTGDLFAGTWWGDRVSPDTGGYAGVYRSSDGGGSWKEVLSGLVSALSVDSAGVKGMYAGTWDGVYHSTDGGDSWSAVNTGLTSKNGVYCLAIPQNTSVLTYAGTNTGAVFRGVTPTIGGTPPTSVYADTEYRFTPIAQDATRFDIANKPNWANFDYGTGTLSGTPDTTALGTYDGIVITAFYNDVQVSLPAFSITVLMPLPAISGTPSPRVTAGNSYSFTPSASYAASFSITNQPSWAQFDPTTGALTGTPTNAAAGNYTGITITATNSAGSVSLAPFSITVDLPAPQIQGNPATQVTAGTGYAFTPAAANALRFAIVNKPAWAAFDSSTGSLTGTPAFGDAGTYTGIVISAANDTATASLPQFSISVILPAPTISGMPATTVTAGSAYRFTPTASNATSFEITNNPTWASFDTATGTLSGTPGAVDAGTFSDIVIKAVNATATASLPNFSITVVSVSQGPALIVSTLPDKSVTNNPILNISGITTSPVGVQSLTINGANVEFDSEGRFSYAVTLSDGENTITVIATDSTGSTTVARTIILDRNAPSLEITTPSDNSTTSSSQIAVAGKVTEPATVAISVNDASPVPAVMDAGNFTATVNLAPGLNTIVFTVVDAAGNTGSAKRTVTLDTSRPALAVTDPPQDIITHSASLLLRGTAGDADSVITVSVTVDGQTSSPVVTQGTFEQPLTFAAEGSHAVDVKATDQAGNSSSVRRNIVFARLLKGDCNMDGKVDLADALWLFHAVTGQLPVSAEALGLADVAPLNRQTGQPDGDGSLDIADVVILLRYLVGAATW